MSFRILITALMVLLPGSMAAHEVRPCYLEIVEKNDHSLVITWKQPVMGDYTIPIRPLMTSNWLIDSLATTTYTETYLVKRWKLPTHHEVLNKQVISFQGLEKTLTDVLVQATLSNDISLSYLIKPIRPFVTIDYSKSKAPPVWQYLEMGIYHIWSGFDHLLFVWGLILLVKKRARLVWTITAFTLAHSITLALATLEIIRVPVAFTEASIALSIVFLAIELLKHYKNVDGFAFRYPWLVSFLFGLLHGLGFASALRDVGLPDNNMTWALLLFNLGVEAGQLFFVCVILLLMAAVRRLNFQLPQWSEKMPAYLIGTLAMFWFIERVVVVMSK